MEHSRCAYALKNYREMLTRIITEEKNYYQLGANQQNVGPFRE